MYWETWWLIPCFSAAISTSVGQMCPLQFISDSGITLRTNSISQVKFWMKLQSAHSVESLIQHRLLFCCKSSCRMETERKDNLIIPLATLHFTIPKTIFFLLSHCKSITESRFTKGFYYVAWKSLRIEKNPVVFLFQGYVNPPSKSAPLPQ